MLSSKDKWGIRLGIVKIVLGMWALAYIPPGLSELDYIEYRPHLKNDLVLDNGKTVHEVYEELQAQSWSDTTDDVVLYVVDLPIVNANARIVSGTLYDTRSVVIYTGVIEIMNYDADMVAAILGHELAHHLSDDMRNPASHRWHKDAEVWADRQGLALAYRAGYRGCEIGQFWLMLSKWEGDMVSTTHPRSIDRYNDVGCHVIEGTR